MFNTLKMDKDMDKLKKRYVSQHIYTNRFYKFCIEFEKITLYENINKTFVDIFASIAKILCFIYF